MSLLTSSQQKAFSTQFWDTILGKFIRWVVYIPTAVLLLLVVEVLSVLFCAWLFGSMSTFVIVGLLFGGIGLLWLGPMAYYGAVVLTTQMICPAPRVGAIVFATLYVLWSAFAFISLIMSDLYAGEFLMLGLLRIVFAITAILAVVKVYSEDVTERMENAVGADHIGIEQRIPLAITKVDELRRGADDYIDAGVAKKMAFSVVLEDVGDRKIGVISVVRETTGLSIKSAKDLVERAPTRVMEGLSKADAQHLKAGLEKLGASVSIKGYLEDFGLTGIHDEAEHVDDTDWDAWLDAEDDSETDDLDDEEHRFEDLRTQIDELRTRMKSLGMNDSREQATESEPDAEGIKMKA